MTEQLTSTALSHEYLDHVTSAMSLQNENGLSFLDDETRHSGGLLFSANKMGTHIQIKKVSCGFFKNSFVYRIQQAGEGIFAREELNKSPAVKEELSPAKK